MSHEPAVRSRLDRRAPSAPLTVLLTCSCWFFAMSAGLTGTASRSRAGTGSSCSAVVKARSLPLGRHGQSQSDEPILVFVENGHVADREELGSAESATIFDLAVTQHDRIRACSPPPHSMSPVPVVPPERRHRKPPGRLQPSPPSSEAAAAAEATDANSTVRLNDNSPPLTRRPPFRDGAKGRVDELPAAMRRRVNE